MTTPTFDCPHCGKYYSLKPEWLGKRVKCNACQQVFRFPEAADPGKQPIPQSAPPEMLAPIQMNIGLEQSQEDPLESTGSPTSPPEFSPAKSEAVSSASQTVPNERSLEEHQIPESTGIPIANPGINMPQIKASPANIRVENSRQPNEPAGFFGKLFSILYGQFTPTHYRGFRFVQVFINVVITLTIIGWFGFTILQLVSMVPVSYTHLTLPTILLV